MPKKIAKSDESTKVILEQYRRIGVKKRRSLPKTNKNKRSSILKAQKKRMKYIFDNSEGDEEFHFEIKAGSVEIAIDELRFYLECHDEWRVIQQDGGVYAVDLYLKNHFIDTLLISEIPARKPVS